MNQKIPLRRTAQGDFCILSEKSGCSIPVFCL